jgi:hypothetical protein
MNRSVIWKISSIFLLITTITLGMTYLNLEYRYRNSMKLYSQVIKLLNFYIVSYDVPDGKLSDVFIPDKDNSKLTVGYLESAKCFLTKINQV